MIASHQLLQKLLRKDVNVLGDHLGRLQNADIVLDDAIGNWPFLDAFEVIASKEKVELLSK